MAIVTVKNRKYGKGIAGISSLLPGPSSVKVGFPAGATDSDNINKAVWNEFGTSRGIPERPFMRNAMRNNKASYKAAMKAAAATIIEQAALGKSAADEKRKALKKLGVLAQGDIQAEITSLRTPPNAASTIRQKGSSNPLINSGEMRAAVTFQIKEK
ncbi:hypothetical protein [Agrobacterium pusense]|uniref:hypothetical protein n=1 Tax=Agrobacterium pusense TaxID=648995 RepID=UPI002FDDD75C